MMGDFETAGVRAQHFGNIRIPVPRKYPWMPWMDVRVESDGRIVVEDEEYLDEYDIGKTTFERYYTWILWRDGEGDQALLFENAQALEKVWEGIQKCLRCQAATTDPGGSPSKLEHRLKYQPVLDDIYSRRFGWSKRKSK